MEDVVGIVGKDVQDLQNQIHNSLLKPEIIILCDQLNLRGQDFDR